MTEPNGILTLSPPMKSRKAVGMSMPAVVLVLTPKP